MANPVQAYAWGSRDGIAALRGLPPSTEPQAELWMGAHPHAPSFIERADGETTRLDDAIAADPVAFLGADVRARFGARLPFMAKVLSAAEPLSLQVHPGDERAREAFEAEDVVGIARTASDRSYRDPYAKPELLLTVTEFEALLGFRPADEAAGIVRRLHVPALSPVAEILQSGRPTGEAFLALVDWSPSERASLVADVARAVSASGLEIASWIERLAYRYPTDSAVVGVLLLNYLSLRPGQAIYVAPGQIHAYLRGTGIEVLGSSDNVVRAGLTPKHVALDELRRVLSLDAVAPSLLSSTLDADGAERWRVPRPEFELLKVSCDGDRREVELRGPAIAFCLNGNVEVADSDSKVALAGCESAFVSASSSGRVTLAGNGVMMCATIDHSPRPALAQPVSEPVRPGGEATSARAEKAKQRRRARNEWFVLLVVVVVGTFLLREYVVQSFRIPSGSMEHTLHGCPQSCNDDRILVNKLAYKLHGIHHGDVVVFKATTPKWIAAAGGDYDVVKRVIGVPGDTVKCCDTQGRVVVDGKSLDEPYVFQDDHKPFGPVTVPKGELWVMGDHRSDSSDSRYNGFVPISSVVGHAFMRIWPVDRLGFL